MYDIVTYSASFNRNSCRVSQKRFILHIRPVTVNDSRIFFIPPPHLLFY